METGVGRRPPYARNLAAPGTTWGTHQDVQEISKTCKKRRREHTTTSELGPEVAGPRSLTWYCQ